MKSNSMVIIALSTVTMLLPAVVFGQADAGYASASMGQIESQPQQGRPQPLSQQPSMQPSMQDSTGSSGDHPQIVKDKMFLRKAAEGGIAEVKFGELAAQKAGSDDVKALGQKMVDDHTALRKSLDPIADNLGVKLPSHMSKEDQTEYDKLNGMSGSDFDTEYLTLMVKDHHKDLRAFRLEMADTQDPSLREVVMKGQEIIHDHLVTVNNLAKSKGIPLRATTAADRLRHRRSSSSGLSQEGRAPLVRPTYLGHSFDRVATGRAVEA